MLDLFLQILDAARVTMASGETLDLSGFYVVFTSNIAAAEILNLQHSEKLVFNRLSYDVQMEIARLHIARELSFLCDKGFDLTLGHFVVSFLMQRGFHPRLGARPLRDTIERYLRGAVADAMLAEAGRNAFEVSAYGDELALVPRSAATVAVDGSAISGPTSPA